MYRCVSPVEHHVSETLNTLKYASRARSIRNHADVTVSEAGWGDLTYLQAMVVKLRKELATVRATDPSSPDPSAQQQIDSTGPSSESLLALKTQLGAAEAELKMLRQKTDGTQSQDELQFSQIVAPVIEEYEKTMGGLEADLRLVKAALTHTNEAYAEKELELQSLKAELTSKPETSSNSDPISRRQLRQLEQLIQTIEPRLATSHLSDDQLYRDVVTLKHGLQRLSKENEQSDNFESATTSSDADKETLVQSLTSQLSEKQEALSALENRLRTLESVSESQQVTIADLHAEKQSSSQEDETQLKQASEKLKENSMLSISCL